MLWSLGAVARPREAWQTAAAARSRPGLLRSSRDLLFINAEPRLKLIPKVYETWDVYAIWNACWVICVEQEPERVSGVVERHGDSGRFHTLSG